MERRIAGPEPIVPPLEGRALHGTRQSGTLASNDFTYYFTFFSKFFSSFPHGTCSLSVSRKYLALEGHYLPVSAAVPSNTTHGIGPLRGLADRTGLLPSLVRCLNNELYPLPVKRPNPDHNSTPGVDADFRIELIPVHSLLLGESWLVSFPPLSNMFKFGGSSRLSPALSYKYKKKSHQVIYDSLTPSDANRQ